MSGISMPVSVSDGLSSPFQSMTAQVSRLVKEYEKLHQTMSQPLSPTIPSIPRGGIGDSGPIAPNPYPKMIPSQQEFNNGLAQGNNMMGRMVGQAKMLVGAYAGFQGVKAFAGMADTYMQTQARIGLINDGLQSTEQLNNMIFNSANRVRGSYMDIAQNVTKLGIMAKDSFSSNAEIVKFTELMSKQFKVGGAGLQEQQAAMYQLSQAMASGRLQGDEFRSILENAPMLAQAIKKELNGIDLKKASAEGLITADIIKRAMFNSADDIEKKFKELPMTFGEAWTIAKNHFVMAMSPMIQSLQRLMNNQYIQAFGEAIITSFYAIGQVGAMVFNGINSIVTAVGQNWYWLQYIVIGLAGGLVGLAVYLGITNDRFSFLLPIILGVVGGFIAYKAILIGISVWHGIVAATQMTASFVMELYGVATGKAMAAQFAFNAALMANPWLWVIVGIIALISILFIVVAVINHVTGSHISAIGIICGAFMFLWTIVFNVFKYIANIASIVAEFLANVFTHPIYSVQRLFVNLAKNALGMAASMTSCFDGVATNIANAMIDGANMAIRAVNWLIEALNKIPGVNLSTMGEFAHTSSITHSIKTAEGNLDKWLETSKPDDYKAVALNLKFTNPMDGAMSGYNFGKGIGDKIKNALKFDKDKTKDEGKTMGQLGEMANNLGNGGSGGKALKDTAKNTDKTAKNTESAVNDIRYLRDLAEREAINRYTTAVINIQNHVEQAQTEDIDGFVNKLSKKLQEELNIQAEGSYAV